MYLLDNNVWLERLLDQEKSIEVGQFLDRITSEHLYITDFAFHSIVLVLTKLDKKDGLIRFIKDTLIEGATVLVHLEPEDILRVMDTIDRFNLDFDDAYQYVAAEKYGLTLISFDCDFDHTERGRKLPSQI